jgi:hypothetical protein
MMVAVAATTTSVIEAMRCLTPAGYSLLLLRACLALGFEALGTFGFFFAPGWANGWPGGLTIYQVWSAWLTVTFFVMLITVGVGVGCLISLLACVFPVARRHSGYVFGTWMVLWAVLSVATSSWAYAKIYASTLEMWPNGYPG